MIQLSTKVFEQINFQGAKKEQTRFPQDGKFQLKRAVTVPYFVLFFLILEGCSHMYIQGTLTPKLKLKGFPTFEGRSNINYVLVKLLTYILIEGELNRPVKQFGLRKTIFVSFAPSPCFYNKFNKHCTTP